MEKLIGEGMTSTNGQVEFSSLFRPDHVLCAIESDTRDVAIMELLRKLAYEHGIGNVGKVFEEVLAREEEMSTIIGEGIAMPHARIESVRELVVGVATSPNGVAWTDGSSVNLMILLLIPKENPGIYLQAMSALAQVCSDPGAAQKIAGLRTPDEVWRFFERGGLILPDYICAGDIMDDSTIHLHENDTLQKAIDLFVKHGLLNLAVVDSENELVGVVSAQEFLRVVLPDYILWMDDLSPIINFEPFADILRRESTTWLAEIMATEFATVQIDSPAVQVAKEMTRLRTDCVYVLEGRKLRGEITLRRFMDKVLRE